MWLILGLVALVVVAGIIDWLGDDMAFVVLPTIILVIVMFLGTVQYIGSIGESAELAAYYDANRVIYEAAIPETKDATMNLEPSGAVLADLPHMQEGIEVAKRVQEKRDSLIHYNITLAKRRLLDTHWLVGAFFYNTDLRLEPIS